MGSRSRYESLARVFVILLQRRSVQQAELARELDLTTKSTRALMEALQAADPRIVRDEDPPHVYWSVPKGWFPHLRTVFSAEECAELLRLLGRLPKSAARDRLLKVLVGDEPLRCNGAKVAVEESILTVLEDGWKRRVPVQVRYHSAHRGHVGKRDWSVQHIEYGSVVRVAAWCHARQKLLSFRADRVHHANLAEQVTFVSVPEAELSEFLKSGVDGYVGDGPAREYVFGVRDPEARWVRYSEPFSSFQVEDMNDGVRMRAWVNAPERLARELVGLGAAVVVETPALRAMVRDLALGALQANAPQVRKGAARSGARNRETG